MLADKLQALLDKTKDEREVAAFLKKNPSLVIDALVRLGDGCCVIAEFPFGSQFKADFVVLAPFSAGWEVHFVELEPPNATLFTKKGMAAARLNGAIAQVGAWRTFINKNRPTVLTDLTRLAKERDLIRGPRKEAPTCHVGWPIDHRSAIHNLNYDIVIGRRAKLSEADLERKAAYKKNQQIEVMTFDRFVETARHHEKR